jgi:hypothetical protein
VVDGKLTLSLRDAVVLTLENNSGVRIQETQIETSKFALLGAHAPFDPLLTAYYNVKVLLPRLSASCREPAPRPRSSLQRKTPSLITRKPLRPEPTYRPDWAPTTTTQTILSSFTTLMSPSC